MTQNSNKVSQLLTITQGQDCINGFAGHFWLHEVWSYVSELKSSEALSEKQSQIKAILFTICSWKLCSITLTSFHSVVTTQKAQLIFRGRGISLQL